MPPPRGSDLLGKGTRDRAVAIQVHQAWVWRYLRFLGCDPALADDLTQETFVAVLQSERAIARGALRGYLRKTAESLWIKACRSRSRSTPLQDVQLANESYAVFCAEDDGDSYLDALRLCVGELSERRRTVLELRYQKGLSRRDVAQRFGMSEDGLKSLVNRAFKRLRDCIEHRRRGDARE